MRPFLLLAPALVSLALFSACKTSEKITIVNPTDQPLFVQIDEREPFEVPPGDSVHTTIPALERLSPLTITARDGRGTTVFFQATSLPRLVEEGRRVELTSTGPPIDPFAPPTPYLPSSQ